MYTPEERKAAQRKAALSWRARNLERARASSRTSMAEKRARDPAAANAKTMAWQKANPEKVKASRRGYWFRCTPEQRTARLLQKRVRIAGVTPTRPMPERCECCGGLPGEKSMNLDHCHQTGQFRGWLCMKCNSGIGKLGDDVAGLQRAITYLERVAKANH